MEAADTEPAPRTKPSGGRLPTATPAEQVRRITIGLDFGTSSTKCMFREEIEGAPFYVVAHERSVAAYGPVLFPSSVSARSDELVFGHEAERGAGVIRSFKMCLPCQARSEEGGLDDPPGPCPRCLGAQRGHFVVGGRTLSAEDVSTLYLAVVIRQASERIRTALRLKGNGQQTRVHVNSAAPLSQLNESSRLAELFERSLYYACRLAPYARERWGIDEACTALARARAELMPPASKRATNVFPETHAAMTAYLLQPERESGLYATLDVGAGSTDVAFFHLHKSGATTKAWYYAMGTTFVGLDDVDRSLASVLPSALPPRQAREDMSNEDLDEHRDLFIEHVERMYRHQMKVFYDARAVDQRRNAWNRESVVNYKLFLIGGGARCEPVAARLEEPPTNLGEWREEPAHLEVPRSVMATGPGGRLKSLVQTDHARSSLLLLAYGLAHRKVDIPPHGVDKTGVEATELERQGWTPEELFGHF